jgi:hypothetical protein
MKYNPDFETIIGTAMREGEYSAMNCIPPTMYVTDRAGRIVEEVTEGVCGFAWVNVKPGNSAFARYLKETNVARKDSYYGGVTVWVSHFNQSYERKMAYARAFAGVLQQHGINAHAMGRLD